MLGRKAVDFNGFWTHQSSAYILLFSNECTCFTGCVTWNWSCCLLPLNSSLSRERAGWYSGSFRSIWYSCDNSELHCTLLKVDLLIRYLDFSFPLKSSLQLVMQLIFIFQINLVNTWALLCHHEVLPIINNSVFIFFWAIILFKKQINGIDIGQGFGSQAFR